MNTTQEQNQAGKQLLTFHERNLRTAILALLLREAGMPRAMLSEKLQTTPAMVTRCVQRMRTEGLVYDEGRSKGSGGRMCTNVALNPGVGLVIGIEYGREEISTLAVNFAGGIEKKCSFPVPKKAHDGSPSELLPTLFDIIRKTFKDIARSRPLLGVAAVDPGVIDTLTGVTVSSNVLSKWKQVPVHQRITDEFKVPVYLSNTANAILAAIDRCELNRRYADLLYLEYREGVACAIKSNGRQVLGARGMAGELTWLDLDAMTRGDRSNPSYVEQALSFSGIRQRLHDLGHTSFPDAMTQADSANTILKLASQGDRQVLGILRKAWYELGQVCGSLANFLDPAVIVLDPHFGQADAGSLEVLKQGLREQMVAPHADQIDIIVSKLQEFAAPLGAALTLLDELIFTGALVC